MTVDGQSLPVRQDLSHLSHSDLIARVSSLQSQLEVQTAQIAALTAANHKSPSSRSSTVFKKPKKSARPFDISKYNTRHIALKFSYLGHNYNGYEHASGCFTPLPTIEEVLWKALRKARLIGSQVAPGVDDTYDVVFDTRDRERKYYEPGRDGELDKVRLELNWDGCQYSKCGRTDRGVSAFGQVIGVRLRSNQPKLKSQDLSDDLVSSRMTNDDHDQAVQQTAKPVSDDFDPIRDELPYIQMINNVLPPDIRILAWCPYPPDDFDARFSCQERQYKYFFTNPAFCPVPGTQGLMNADNTTALTRQGWLNVEKMRMAAKKLEGLHDFRNLCKIDASKQMPSCERRITFADVTEIDTSLSDFVHLRDLNADGREVSSQDTAHDPTPAGPKVYAFSVHGTAFLWHQVRCMVAVLFLVGQGLEQPEIIDKLLDIQSNPARPNYEMADDAPLVLWDCIFPSGDTQEESGLNWIYSGDEVTVNSALAKHDGKFGPGGIVDDLWTEWQEVKLREAQLACLLSMSIRQGDGSAFNRGGQKQLPVPSSSSRSQKVFTGNSKARLVGKYIPVMQRPKLDTLEVQNAKYMAGKGTRREEKKSGVLSTSRED